VPFSKSRGAGAAAVTVTVDGGGCSASTVEHVFPLVRSVSRVARRAGWPITFVSSRPGARHAKRVVASRLRLGWAAAVPRRGSSTALCCCTPSGN